LDDNAVTGYTVHTGTSKKFASGWDRVFSGQPKAKGAAKSAARKGARKVKRRKSS
jgi:hypothetical protein